MSKSKNLSPSEIDLVVRNVMALWLRLLDSPLRSAAHMSACDWAVGPDCAEYPKPIDRDPEIDVIEPFERAVRAFAGGQSFVRYPGTPYEKVTPGATADEAESLRALFIVEDAHAISLGSPRAYFSMAHREWDGDIGENLGKLTASSLDAYEDRGIELVGDLADVAFRRAAVAAYTKWGPAERLNYLAWLGTQIARVSADFQPGTMREVGTPTAEEVAQAAEVRS